LSIDAVIKIIRSEDEPKPILMKRFKISDLQAESILELKLRHLAKLEEMKIKGEQDELAAEKVELDKVLKSKARLTKLIREELVATAEAHSDERRTALVERAPAQALDESVLVSSDPVTVVLSERGYARAAKGHEVDTGSLSYRSGDQFLAAARGLSNQLAVFLDSTGRAYSLAAHTLPSARGQGEPLSGRLKPPDGATFRSVMIGGIEDRWVLASSSGYGFVAKLEDLQSRNKAGKVAINPGKESMPIVAAPVAAEHEGDLWLAAVSSDGYLLIFPLEELPELARGKGNKIVSLPAKDKSVRLAAVAVIDEAQSLRIICGQRAMTLKQADMERYEGSRGRRGAVLPRNYRNVTALAAN
jgi:topoisomerase-4 subunit A